MPLHPAPVTLQITTLSLVPLTVTTNCNGPPAATCAFCGESESDTAAGAAIAESATHKNIDAATTRLFILSIPTLEP
jgi:hypothetical protein